GARPDPRDGVRRRGDAGAALRDLCRVEGAVGRVRRAAAGRGRGDRRDGSGPAPRPDAHAVLPGGRDGAHPRGPPAQAERRADGAPRRGRARPRPARGRHGRAGCGDGRRGTRPPPARPGRVPRLVLRARPALARGAPRVVVPAAVAVDLVGPVAPGRDRGAAAPAQRDRRAVPLDLAALGVDEPRGPAHEQRTVGAGRHGHLVGATRTPGGRHRATTPAARRRPASEWAARRILVPAYGTPPRTRQASASHTHTARSTSHAGARSAAAAGQAAAHPATRRPASATATAAARTPTGTADHVARTAPLDRAAPTAHPASSGASASSATRR